MAETERAQIKTIRRDLWRTQLAELSSVHFLRRLPRQIICMPPERFPINAATSCRHPRALPVGGRRTENRNREQRQKRGEQTKGLLFSGAIWSARLLRAAQSERSHGAASV